MVREHVKLMMARGSAHAAWRSQHGRCQKPGSFGSFIELCSEKGRHQRWLNLRRDQCRRAQWRGYKKKAGKSNLAI